jgi:hypothetical protein
MTESTRKYGSVGVTVELPNFGVRAYACTHLKVWGSTRTVPKDPLFLGYSLVQLAECFWEKSYFYSQGAELGAAYA